MHPDIMTMANRTSTAAPSKRLRFSRTFPLNDWFVIRTSPRHYGLVPEVRKTRRTFRYRDKQEGRGRTAAVEWPGKLHQMLGFFRPGVRDHARMRAVQGSAPKAPGSASPASRSAPLGMGS
jgi:hypothetical protein